MREEDNAKMECKVNRLLSVNHSISLPLSTYVSVCLLISLALSLAPALALQLHFKCIYIAHRAI